MGKDTSDLNEEFKDLFVLDQSRIAAWSDKSKPCVSVASLPGLNIIFSVKIFICKYRFNQRKFGSNGSLAEHARTRPPAKNSENQLIHYVGR